MTFSMVDPKWVERAQGMSLRDAERSLIKINNGLLAAFECVAIGQEKKAVLEKRINDLRTRPRKSNN